MTFSALQPFSTINIANIVSFAFTFSEVFFTEAFADVFSKEMLEFDAAGLLAMALQSAMQLTTIINKVKIANIFQATPIILSLLIFITSLIA